MIDYLLFDVIPNQREREQEKVKTPQKTKKKRYLLFFDVSQLSYPAASLIIPLITTPIKNLSIQPPEPRSLNQTHHIKNPLLKSSS